MSIYITAQLIGFIGYLFYIAAPYFKTQKQIVQIDALACLVVAIQWYLLNQPSLLILNILVIITSIIAIKAPQYKYILYPIGCFIIIITSNNNIVDILAIIIFCTTVASKTSENIDMLRIYAISGGILLIISGIIAMSLPAIIFNLLFITAHIVRLWNSGLYTRIVNA